MPSSPSDSRVRPTGPRRSPRVGSRSMRGLLGRRAGHDDTGVYRNFGRSVAYTPARHFRPASEAEVLEILDEERAAQVRVVGSGHSFGELVRADGAVTLDLACLDTVGFVRRASGEVDAVVGAGCTIERLLAQLDRALGLTLPTVGGVTQQTIAGAIATATHGSGPHSLSHYVQSMRIAVYDPTRDRHVVADVADGDALAAARCGLGCCGVVLSVRIACVRQYWVRQTVRRSYSVDEVLARGTAFPLQYFLVVPFRWELAVFERAPTGTRPGTRERVRAALRRLVTLATVDFAFHLCVAAMPRLLGSPRRLRFIYGALLPVLLLRRRATTDRSDRALTLAHHWFRHVELELAVPEARLASVIEIVREVTEVFAGVRESVSSSLRQALRRHGLEEALAAGRGRYVLAYPISCRRLREDDALISMSSRVGDRGGARITLSFFAYDRDLSAFGEYASFVARALGVLEDARPHWGKIFPIGADDVERLYGPALERFRSAASRADLRGTFRNAFTADKLGLPLRAAKPETPAGAEM